MCGPAAAITLTLRLQDWSRRLRLGLQVPAQRQDCCGQTDSAGAPHSQGLASAAERDVPMGTDRPPKLRQVLRRLLRGHWLLYYLLCEYMPGGSLLDRHNALRPQQATPPQTPQMLRQMRQIATAIKHLHSKKILHRDLKSANVLVAEDGRLVVADFGLARYCRECWRVEPHTPRSHPTELRCLAVPLIAPCLWLPRRVGLRG